MTFVPLEDRQKPCGRCGVRIYESGTMCQSCVSLTYRPREDLDWMTEGSCRQVGGDLWYPNKGGSVSAAKLVCNGDYRRGVPRCPVRDICREYALRWREEHGVWGGMSAHERDLYIGIPEAA
jgi:WhiB family transcriptional regulator, redox-sensing transcriptional regulator